MLTICTWLWGTKYGMSDVAKLMRGLDIHLKQPHRFILINEFVPEDKDLLNIKGCFVRLRMFDPHWQSDYGVDERLACIDLDTVITGPLDPVFDRPEPFLILQGANASNPCPFNGSLMMLRAGAYPNVWSEFSLEAAQKIPFFEFPDDQGWLHHKIPGAAGWKVGSPSGVYAFHKPGWPTGEGLPADARIVVFPGWRTPKQFKHLPWVKEHWK